MTLSYDVIDGHGSSIAGSQSYSLAAVNDTPVNSAPGNQTMSEDGTLVFSAANGNAITTNDIDNGPGGITVLIQFANGLGTLTIPGSAPQQGIQGVSGDFQSTVLVSNNGSNLIVVGGLVADVNKALDGLVFTPAANLNGPITILVQANDHGATGAGGSQIDTDTFQIQITPVNDVPTGGATAVLAAGTEDVAYIVSAANLLAGFSDVDGDVTPAFHPAATRDRPVLSRMSAVEATGGFKPARCFSSSAANAAGVA